MFDAQGFMNAINNLKQRPRTEWMDFVKNMYQSQNKNFTEYEQQARQLVQSNNPQLMQFQNMINNQFGIKF